MHRVVFMHENLHLDLPAHFEGLLPPGLPVISMRDL